MRPAGFGDVGTDKETGGRVEDVEILLGSDKAGQDYERAHQINGTGQTFWTQI